MTKMVQLQLKITGYVNTAKVGSYTLVYTATDKAGNKATKTRTVKVLASPDIKAPKITIPGYSASDPRVAISGNSVPKATATDDRDGTVKVTVTYGKGIAQGSSILKMASNNK